MARGPAQGPGAFPRRIVAIAMERHGHRHQPVVCRPAAVVPFTPGPVAGRSGSPGALAVRALGSPTLAFAPHGRCEHCQRHDHVPTARWQALVSFRSLPHQIPDSPGSAPCVMSEISGKPEPFATKWILGRGAPHGAFCLVMGADQSQRLLHCRDLRRTRGHSIPRW